MERKKTATKREITDQLAAIAGDVRAIQGMVAERRSCEDIIAQVVSARIALDGIAASVVSGHVSDCLANLPEDKARAAIDKAVRLMRKIS